MADPVASVPAGDVLKMGSKVEGRVRPFAGVFGDVSVVESPASDTGTWQGLSEEKSLIGSEWIGSECYADCVFVYADKGVDSGAENWGYCTRGDGETIAGIIGVDRTRKKSGASGLSSIVAAWSGDAGQAGVGFPGEFLPGVEVPKELIGGFE